MIEGPYELPKGWRWVRLGEVCSNTERRNPARNPDSSFLYVDISSVDNQSGEIVKPKKLLGREAPSRARKVVRKDDVIFATTRPYLKNIARIPPELDGQICSTGFCVLRPSIGQIDPAFLFHISRSDLIVRQVSANNMRGASYPAVTDRDVYQTLIPLPPLPEQRRIVARIEELMERVQEAKRLREEAKQDADRLMQAALAEVFPRPGTEPPPGWRWVRLGEVCELYQPKTITKREIKAKPGPYPVFGANGVIGSFAEYNHEEPQVLVTCRGATCGTVNKSLPRSWITGNAMVTRPRDKELDKEYLFFALRATDLAAAIGGSAQPQITRATLSPIPIPLPPLPEQRRIVAYLDKVQAHVTALKQAQEATETELHRLEQAILDKAFRGEL